MRCILGESIIEICKLCIAYFILARLTQTSECGTVKLWDYMIKSVPILDPVHNEVLDRKLGENLWCVFVNPVGKIEHQL